MTLDGRAAGQRKVERRHLEYLLAVVEHGGFASAARRLGVTAATVARAIHALEELVGTTLFVPTIHPPQLTPAGQVAVQAARRSLHYLDAVQYEVNKLLNLEAGQLTIVTLPTLSDVVSRLVGSFRREYPGIRVHLEAPAKPLLNYAVLAVESGAADLAFTELTGDTGKARALDLGEQEYVAVLPPGTRRPGSGVMPPSELMAHGLVVGAYYKNSLARRLLHQSVPQIDDAVILETDYREMVNYLVLEGVGAGVVLADRGQFARALGLEVVPLRPPVRRRIGILYLPGKLSPAAQRFLDMCRDERTATDPAPAATSAPTTSRL